MTPTYPGSAAEAHTSADGFVDAAKESAAHARASTARAVTHAVDTASGAVQALKPKLRGWFHAGTAPVALAQGSSGPARFSAGCPAAVQL